MSSSPHSSTPPPQNDDLGFDIPDRARMTWKRGSITILFVGVALGGAFAWGWLPRRKATADLHQEAAARQGAPRRLEVIKPKLLASDQAIELPGSTRPLEVTILYPRVTGYVRSWTVDLGDRVTEGQTLAEIDTPDLDQELVVAKAELAQAMASRGQSAATLQFSNKDAKRYGSLASAGVASEEQLDERNAKLQVDRATVGVADAVIEARRAAVSRLTELKSFAKVTAPFSGTITERTIERGALVQANTSTPLFKIEATDPIRVMLAIPQDLAPVVVNGLKAKVSLREFPAESFEGTVSRTSRALDPTTRTLLTEVRIPNPKGRILSGMAGKIALTLPAPHAVFEIPGTSILFGANGTQVAVVDADERIRLVKVTIERDTGAAILVSSGLDGSERMVKNATAALEDGQPVEAVEAAPPPAK